MSHTKAYNGDVAVRCSLPALGTERFRVERSGVVLKNRLFE